MTSEPRMRGSRFRRPSQKKKSREKTGVAEVTFPYEEEVTVDPLQVSSKTMNALEHLGTQRFVLPPFSEHFDRWIKDVEVVLTEFETELPDMADQQYRATVQNILSSLRQTLDKQIEAERNSSGETSKLLQELNSCELELSKLGHEYRKVTYETRKKHEKALGKLQSEIDMLDRQRLKLLRKHPSIVERLLGRSASKLEASTNVLQSKRNDFDSKGAMLQHDLDELRAKYDVKRSGLSEHEESLKAKLAELKANGSNDALEVRHAACQDLRVTVGQAVDRSTKDSIPTNTEGSQ
jgi:predicted RNase H-like nuclease (RuvC/YqgF family)